MRFLSRREVMLALTCALLGCRRKSQTASAPPPVPASPPAVGEATLQIDGEPEVFPPAELFLRQDGQSIVATLSTGQATGPAGENSLHFRMTFNDVANPQSLDGEDWHFAAPPDESAEDTPLDRIELHRRAAVLRPVSLTVSLRLTGPQRTDVEMKGSFDLFDPPDSEKAVRQLSVTGRFEATMKTQS